MIQYFRRRFSKEVSVMCLAVGASVGGLQSQVLSQTVQDVIAGSEIIAPENVQQSAIMQSVCLSPDGQLVGQVQLLGMVSNRFPVGLKMFLTGADGKVIESSVGEQGAFAFGKVSPGMYGVFGQSENVVLCEAIRVFDHNTQGESDLKLFAVSPATPEIKRAILSGKRSTEPVNVSSMLPRPTSSYSSTSGLVALSSDGTLRGRLWCVRCDVKGSTVNIYQNGMSVVRTVVDDSGRFSVKLAPGVYSLIASGNGGVAAVGFKAEASNASVSKTKVPKNVKLISLEMAAAAPVLEVGLAPLPPVVSMTGEVVNEERVVVSPPTPMVTSPFVGSPYGGGNFGGGNFGGGGGGGGRGIGGLGALAAVGGLVAVGIAAADNNNDAPATPFSPSGQ